MSAGYSVVASGPNRFRLARTHRPMWASILAVATAVFVGLGLFFLLVKRTETGDAMITEDRSGVKLRLTGALHPLFVDKLRAAFAVPMSVSPPAAREVFMPVAAAPSESVRSVPGHQPRVLPQPVLTFADGQSILVGNGCVIGRNPELDPQLPAGQLIPVNDPSLSKTHVTLGPAANGIWLVDHYSTNGTVVVAGNRVSPCAPGIRTDVPFGACVVAGDVRLMVESR